MKYLNFIEKVNNICVPREAFSLDLATHNIPTGRQTACFYSMARRFREAGNFDALKILHLDSFSPTRIKTKLVDVLYLEEKANSIRTNKTIDMFTVGKTKGLYRIWISPTNSAYYTDGIYSNKELATIVNVINNHYCKVTRLGNGKVQIEHLTHRPTNKHNFTLINNIDLEYNEKNQYKSNIAFEFDENVITDIVDIEDCNSEINYELCNHVIEMDSPLNVISEESFFHYSNDGMRDVIYYERVKKSFYDTYELAEEIAKIITE